jgi:ribosome-binding factor A
MAPRHGERKAVGSYPRTARLNELLREILAEQLERHADTDERLKLSTVTAVAVTPDLAGAKVFMSSIDEDVSGALEDHRKSLQSAIGRQVRLKRTPKLQFVADPAMAEGAKVEEILRRLKAQAANSSDAGE